MTPNVMKTMEVDHPDLGNALRIEALSYLGFAPRRPLFQAASEQASLLFSNLGVLGAPEHFGNAQVTKAYMMSPVIFPLESMLAASSFHGGMTLAVGFCEGGINRVDVESFLDQFEQELLYNA